MTLAPAGDHQCPCDRRHDMMKAAADAVDGRAKLIAVTILTSLSDDDLWAIGFNAKQETSATRLRLPNLRKQLGSMASSAARMIWRHRAATGPDF